MIRHKLKKDITPQEIARILRIASWPQRPFYRAAAQLGLATVEQTFVSEFEKVRNSLTQVELLEDPGSTLGMKLSQL